MDNDNIHENTVYDQSIDTLRIISWNIESLRSKLCSYRNEIYSLIQSYDIIGFLESFQIEHNEFDNDFDMSDWMIFSSIRSNRKGNKPSGGVTVIVKKSIVERYNVAKIFELEDRVYLMIHNVFPVGHNNLVLGFFYIFPRMAQCIMKIKIQKRGSIL
jgi:exonuclease III